MNTATASRGNQQQGYSQSFASAIIELVLAVFFRQSFSRNNAQVTQAIAEFQFNLHLAGSFFDVETCQGLIGEMRRSSSSPALTYAKDNLGSVDERVRKVARLMPSPETVEYVKRRLTAYREKIEEHFKFNLNGCEDPQFLRYRVGDFFVAHQDGNTGLMRLDTDRSRRISISIFLNQQSERSEPNAYCGGSLVFSDWRNGAECRLACEAGTLVAFRSEVTHEVVPVTDGERYSIVSWYG